MNRYNKETLIKLIVLIVLSFIYIKFMATGELLKIMHPRLIPFVKFSIVLMIIVAVSLLINITEDRTKPAYINSYKLFIIPLIIILLFNPSVDLMPTKCAHDEFLHKTINHIAEHTENVTVKEEDLNSEVIEITDKNFLYFMDKIHSDIDSYNNKKVKLQGFIYKEPSFKDREFVIGRYVMSCCASDMQLIGLLCCDNKEYGENTWHEITGTIRKADDINTLDTLYIEVESSKPIEKPSSEYIYP